MKVLIIGGTGLISTPITQMLIDRGDEVTLFNRGQRTARMAHFSGHVRELRGDRRAFGTFEAQVREAGMFDCVIDMIGFHPDEVESAVRAFRGRCGQYIFCSTVDVYARPSFHHPYREGGPLHALSDYGREKIACERILMEAHDDRAFPVTLLRPAHTYDDTGIIHHSLGRSTALLDRIRRGRPVIVHGDGQSLWVSAHAIDVAGGFVGAIGNTRAYGRGYHLPGEEWLTWDGYHRVIADALGVTLPELVHIPTDLLARLAPGRSGVCEVNFQYPNIFDVSAAREDLGYRYTVPVARGFGRIVAHLEATGGITDSDAEPYYDQIIDAWRDHTQAMIDRFAPMGL